MHAIVCLLNLFQLSSYPHTSFLSFYMHTNTYIQTHTITHFYTQTYTHLQRNIYALMHRVHARTVFLRHFLILLFDYKDKPGPLNCISSSYIALPNTLIESC